MVGNVQDTELHKLMTIRIQLAVRGNEVRMAPENQRKRKSI